MQYPYNQFQLEKEGEAWFVDGHAGNFVTAPNQGFICW